ncbi:MAG TPA: hypothetical protein PK915_09535 [Bacteroidales bacterium]|nr:hypothetical protein [Bacteroidales bacterium]
MSINDELRKSGTKGEFDKKVYDFCKTLRATLTNMGFEFELHPDKDILGGQIASREEYKVIGVYADLNALRLNKMKRNYGKYLKPADYDALKNFRDQLPEDTI